MYREISHQGTAHQRETPPEYHFASARNGFHISRDLTYTNISTNPISPGTTNVNLCHLRHRLASHVQESMINIKMRMVHAHKITHLFAKAITMRATEKVKPHRKPTNLSLDSELLREAKALGINVSRSAEAGIKAAVRHQKQMDWLEDNAAALASSNKYVEEQGLPLSQYRQF